MSKTYYKAVRLDGTDFYSGTVRWLPEGLTLPEEGWLVTHPDPHKGAASGYLSVSASPTDCTGMSWPCLLLRVEPDGEVWTPDPSSLPSKRAGHAWRVVEVLDPVAALGPHGAEVAALIQAAGSLTSDQAERLHAAWGAAWGAARDTAWSAAWYAARDAAAALVVRDLISCEHYDALTLPWREVVGPIHP